MRRLEAAKAELQASPKRWAITGVAGFIGSNLLETLLQLGQYVSGLDSFATGHRHNLEDVKSCVPATSWERFQFIEGDICSIENCRNAVEGADFVLHQAALGSVPRSMEDPISSNASNVDGFLNMLVAAKEAEVQRFVYAASSSTYGDHPDLPKVEDTIGNPLSPYAVTKLVNEIYSDVFSRAYGFHSVGLRYFNVFGKRQDPNGAYAAVIPKWIQAVLEGESVTVNGDGSTSRDFCHIDNVVQANILAATATYSEAQVFNVAVGDRTNLVQLFEMIREGLALTSETPDRIRAIQPVHAEFRAGDVLHSQACIEKIEKLLGYEATVGVDEGLRNTCKWFASRQTVA